MAQKAFFLPSLQMDFVLPLRTPPIVFLCFSVIVTLETHFLLGQSGLAQEALCYLTWGHMCFSGAVDFPAPGLSLD
jgi:hypothetical protein